MTKLNIGKVLIEKKYGYFVINGEYYEEKSKDGKPVFVKVAKQKIKKAEKMVKEIVSKLKDSLDREKVLHESIMKLSIDELEPLHNTVFNEKRKVKPKTRRHHCVDMKVGNFIIPIVE